MRTINPLRHILLLGLLLCAALLGTHPLHAQQRRPADIDGPLSGQGFNGEGEEGYVVSELEEREKITRISYTFDELDLDTSLIKRKTLYVNHTINNSYCADSSLKRATLYARLSMGRNDYTFGKTIFFDTVVFRIQMFDSGQTVPYINDTVRLSINNDTVTDIRPEQIYRRAFTNTYYDTDSILITVLHHSNTFAAGSLQPLKDSLFFEVYYVDEFKIKPYNASDSSEPALQLIAQDTVVHDNPVTFEWERVTECVNDTFPSYQFQLLRLFNREIENPGHNERSIVDTVDWSRALTIETGSPATELTLTIAEGTGYYLWRVRPIGDYYPGGIANDRNWGVWTDAPADGTRLAIPATDRAALDAAIRPSVFFYGQFDGDKNWIYTRNFTEGSEGTRISETMTYATALLQKRQNQAHMQSKGKLLINQTVLDFSGRPSLSSLAAPVDGNGFGYQSEFLMAPGSGGTKHLYTAEDFDADANAANPAQVTDGPVADYYSDSNPDTRVPSAEGYPFTRTLFYPDATGRVMEQSGAGDVHHLGSSASGDDRTVKTFYGQPSDEELVSMFGDEAPFYGAVQKVMTLDPNKVASVKYISKEGQTLATCLVKFAAANTLLDEIPEQQVFQQTIHQYLGKSSRLGDYGAVSSMRVVLPELTNLVLTYKLTPKLIQGACGSYCASCDYTVKFLIHPAANPSTTVFEETTVVSPVNCDSAGGSTGGGGTAASVRDTMIVAGLSAGSYIIERIILANNLAPDTVGYLRKHADSVAEIMRGQTDQALDSVRKYLDSSDLDGLYAYLEQRVHDDPTHADTTRHDSIGRKIYTLKSEIASCWEIEILKQTCDDESPCGTPLQSFEQIMIDRWGTTFGTTLDGYFFDYNGHALYPRVGAFASSGGRGMFDAMIGHMIDDGYDCAALWKAWNKLVQTFPYMATENGSGNPAEMDHSYNLLEAFLSIVGKQYEGVSNCPYGDCTSGGSYSYGLGYLEYAYRYFLYEKTERHRGSLVFISGNRNPACEDAFQATDLIIDKVSDNATPNPTKYHIPPVGPPVWEPDTLGIRFDTATGRRAKKNWEDFYDCLRGQTPPPKTVTLPADCDPPTSQDCLLALKERNEKTCRDACESRIPSFRRAVRNAYYDAGKIVEGDTVTPDGNRVNSGGYLLDTAGIPTDSIVPSVPLRDVECQVQTLLQHCQEGCTLTVTTQSGVITQIGTTAEHGKLVRSTTYGFRVALPVGGSCADTSMTLLTNADAQHSFARRAVQYLNDTLSRFRYHGGDSARPDSIARWFHDAFSAYTGLASCPWYLGGGPIDTTYNACCPPEGMPGIFTLREGITSEFVLDGCMLVYVRRCHLDSTELVTRDTLCANICYDSCAGPICFKWVDILPPTDTIGAIYPLTCEDMVARRIRVAIDRQQGEIIDRESARVMEEYRGRCIDPVMIDDSLDVSFPQTLYHFTLYYYDRAGNLVKTVPPLGVKLIQPLPTPRRSTHPQHVMATVYEYNSLKQLIRQITPDGGITRFWYDRKGRQRFRQDAAQFLQRSFSYVLYDSLGRTVETGQNILARPGILEDSVDSPFYPATNSTDVVATVYSTPGTVGYALTNAPQRFIQNRVSYTKTKDIITEYSYDPHGNVEWVMHSISKLGNSFVRYEYDLISNKVLALYLNEGRRDQYSQRYAYDEDNRITKVESSRDRMIWDRDAGYEYYAHGPLRRATYGEDSLQGTDYTYTIQGWLKALNHPSLATANDPGGDGNGASVYAPDAFGMVLGYYEGDFGHTGSLFNSGLSHTAAARNLNAPTGLYNGNITSWTARHFVPGAANCMTKATTLNGDVFRYDRLNRLLSSTWNTYAGTSWTTGTDYFSSYSYDPNGNILKLTRNGCNAGGQLHIDSLTYNYPNPGVTNLLGHVDDKIGNAVSVNDLDDQAAVNYTYDASGRMISDRSVGITAVTWDSYGKVASVGKQVWQLRFRYDAAGNRVKKVLDNDDGRTVYYIRDAGGKVLAEYTKPSADRDDPSSVTDGCIRVGGSVPSDQDQDGVPDAEDNAPGFPNPGQGDADGDGDGDVIDIDSDNDGIGNLTDPCPFNPGPCASDHDNDGIPDSLDPCPGFPGQAGGDQDQDGTPDGCDGDLDGDGVPNHEDNCIYVFNPDQADADTNGVGDVCQCPPGWEGSSTIQPEIHIARYYIYGNGVDDQFADARPKLGAMEKRDTTELVDTVFTRRVELKSYTLKDHLGNSRATYSDLKLDANQQGVGPYTVDYESHTNYYPFGMTQELRSAVKTVQPVAGDYLYNGKEYDYEWENYDYGFRIYNPRVARFLSVDPLSPSYPDWSPYAFAMNRPVDGVDLDGLEFTSKSTSRAWAQYDSKLKVMTIANLPYANNFDPMFNDFLFHIGAYEKVQLGNKIDDLPENATVYKQVFKVATSNGKELDVHFVQGRFNPRTKTHNRIENKLMGNPNAHSAVGALNILGVAEDFIMLWPQADQNERNIINRKMRADYRYTQLAIEITTKARGMFLLPLEFRGANGTAALANYMIDGTLPTAGDAGYKARLKSMAQWLFEYRALILNQMNPLEADDGRTRILHPLPEDLKRTREFDASQRNSSHPEPSIIPN